MNSSGGEGRENQTSHRVERTTPTDFSQASLELEGLEGDGVARRREDLAWWHPSAPPCFFEPPYLPIESKPRTVGIEVLSTETTTPKEAKRSISASVML